MFGNRKKEETATTATSTPSSKTPSVEGNALNSLVKGTTVEGSISSESDIRIDGTIKGNLSCKAKVIIGPSGFIDGEVRCQNAMIEGKLYGKLRVTELLTIKETAEVIGDVSTGKLHVANGAVFNVTCSMKDSLSSNNSNGIAKPLEKRPELVTNAQG